MMPDNQARRDELIREQAYHLWMASGSAHGTDLQHWDNARQIVDGRAATALPSYPRHSTGYEGGVSAQPPSC